MGGDIRGRKKRRFHLIGVKPIIFRNPPCTNSPSSAAMKRLAFGASTRIGEMESPDLHYSCLPHCCATRGNDQQTCSRRASEPPSVVTEKRIVQKASWVVQGRLELREANRAADTIHTLLPVRLPPEVPCVVGGCHRYSWAVGNWNQPRACRNRTLTSPLNPYQAEGRVGFARRD